MHLLFNTTTWQNPIEEDIELSVSYDPNEKISLKIWYDHTIRFSISIRSKEDLNTYFTLIHIASIISIKGLHAVDKNEFIDNLVAINIRRDTTTDSDLIFYAKYLFKYGKDLWELLGKSNLMFLL